MKACTAGGTRDYPYGDEYEPDACNGGTSTGLLVPTGQLSSCEGGLPGLFDMVGNAWEWELEHENVASPPLEPVCWLRAGYYMGWADAMRCGFNMLNDCEGETGSGIRCCGRAE